MKKFNYNLNKEEFNSVYQEIVNNKIEHQLYKYSCSVKLETNECIFNCSLTGNKEDIISIGNIANTFYKICNIHDLKGQYGYKETKDNLGKTHISWDYDVAYGWTYTHPTFARKPLKCWSYDVNSAFPFAMLQQMPDTRQKPKYNAEIGKHEIGFYKHGGVCITPGEIADIVFPLMDSPFKEYVVKTYIKKTNSDEINKMKCKAMLNYPTGLLARKNIFLRNALVFYSNQYIQKFVDENTVYCNVDCIVSLVPRYDIPIGPSIGQFKQEHVCEDFKYLKAMFYQWGNECHYPGIPGIALLDIEDTKNWFNYLPYKFVTNIGVLDNENKRTK